MILSKKKKDTDREYSSHLTSLVFMICWREKIWKKPERMTHFKRVSHVFRVFCGHSGVGWVSISFHITLHYLFYPTANHTLRDNIVTNSTEGATGSCSQRWKPFNDTATNAAVVMWPLMGPLTELFPKSLKMRPVSTGYIINNKPSPYAAHPL